MIDCTESATIITCLGLGGITLDTSIAREDTRTARRKRRPRFVEEARKSVRKHWQLYLVIIPPLLFFAIFKYYPMLNAVLAFKDYNVTLGIWGSPWVGLRNFQLFFDNPMFWPLVRNTILISGYLLLAGFPVPILLALMLNEVRSGRFKRMVQLVTFAPYFISTVVMVSIIMLFLAPRLGFVNVALDYFGMETVNFLGEAGMFRSIYVWSDIWQTAGYSAVIYLAALAGIDPTLYEAARVDGASRLQKIVHVDLPGLMPTITIILILNVGSVMAIGFEKIYLLQNPLNMVNSEIIATYVYKIGLLNANYSFATAVGLFNSLINLVLLVAVNALARRFTKSSIW
ncbi:ABC transporter permease [Paenibacillus daejeonensis]|uniref:ABC transporter permease n=1 Tax=Paenibacillus daejeonensis TaxID=135193 RepID=UPI0003653272|nr:ABC transporter permease subunit [Paenibacillus daejeonensis]